MKFFLLLSLLFVYSIAAERCPPYFGEHECPLGFSCRESKCYSPSNQFSESCANVQCSEETTCVDGKCYPITTVKCNRHVLTAEGEARSIASDCGRKGKCVNGQCVVDKCLGISCDDGELCRDGKCVNLVDQFCIGHADCGPALDCVRNKCTLRPNIPLCSCNPNEICHKGNCLPNTLCTTVVCPAGQYCVDGNCANAVGLDCTDDICHGNTVCVEGRCQMDECPTKCPADHDCRLGQCRALQGLPCSGECPLPYECVNGQCMRNECALKVCQLGESCEGYGACVQVAGRFCTLATRDCGFAFKCIDNKCVDLLSATINTQGK